MSEQEKTDAELSASDNQQTVYGVQMPANKVREAIELAKNTGKINDEEGELIYWLYNYGQDKKLPYSAIGDKIGLSGTTVHQIFHGKYAAANWKPVMKAIRSFQRVEIEELKKKNIGFVETETAKTIFLACQAALNDGMPAFIYGASQIGKTTALLEFQRLNNHGKTKYIRMGSSWSKPRFVREFARSCNCFSNRATTAELEDKIIASLNRYNLVIVDEFHLALETTTDNESKRILEYIREVFDRTQCGLVMAATKVGLSGLENGRNQMLFDQLRRRGVVKVVLPDVPKLKDINAIARSFDLPAPAGETLANVKLLLKGRGLNVFIKYLQKAYALAKEEKKTLDWAMFESVNDGYATLAVSRNDY